MNKNAINYIALVELSLKVFNFSIFILLARFLDKSEFGLVQQIFLIVYIFLALFSNALPIGLSYFYGQYKKFTYRQYMYKRFYFTLILSLMVSFVLYLIIANALASSFNNQYLSEYSILIAMTILVMGSSVYFKNYSLISKDIKYYAQIMISGLVIMFVSVVFVSFYSIDVESVLLVYLIGYGCIFIAMTIKQRVNIGVKTNGFLISKQELAYVLPVTAVGLISVINELIDQVMVSAMLSPEDMADLKVGAFQIPFIAIITGSVATVLVPKFSEMMSDNKAENITALWKKLTDKVVLLLLPMFVFSLIFAKEIIFFLFSSKYELAPTVFQIYTLKYLFTVITFGAVMASIGLQKWWLFNLIVVVSANVVLNYFAIAEFGVLGAVCVTTLVWYLGASMQVLQINRKLGCCFFDYFPWLKYLKVFVVSVLLGLVLKLFYLKFVFTNSSVVLVALLYYVAVFYVFERKLISLNELKKIEI